MSDSVKFRARRFDRVTGEYEDEIDYLREKFFAADAVWAKRSYIAKGLPKGSMQYRDAAIALEERRATQHRIMQKWIDINSEFQRIICEIGELSRINRDTFQDNDIVDRFKRTRFRFLRITSVATEAMAFGSLIELSGYVREKMKELNQPALTLKEEAAKVAAENDAKESRECDSAKQK